MSEWIVLPSFHFYSREKNIDLRTHTTIHSTSTCKRALTEETMGGDG